MNSFLAGRPGTRKAASYGPPTNSSGLRAPPGRKWFSSSTADIFSNSKNIRQRIRRRARDYSIVMRQLDTLREEGHSLQLHIHPHWEDSYYAGDKWVLKTERYRLHDFSEKEIEEIVFRYKKVLTDIVGDRVFAFRAGGWCLQPFAKIKAALEKKRHLAGQQRVFRGGAVCPIRITTITGERPDRQNGISTTTPSSRIRRAFLSNCP